MQRDKANNHDSKIESNTANKEVLLSNQELKSLLSDFDLCLFNNIESMLAVNNTTYAFTDTLRKNINFYTFSVKALPKHIGSIPHEDVYCMVMVNETILASSSRYKVKTWDIEKFLNNTKDAKSAELSDREVRKLERIAASNPTLVVFNNRYLISMISTELEPAIIGSTKCIEASLLDTLDTKEPGKQYKFDHILLKSRQLKNSHISPTGELSLLVWKYKTFKSHLRAENYHFDPTQKCWLRESTTFQNFPPSIYHSALNTRPLSATTYLAACIVNYTSRKGPLIIEISSYSPNSKPTILFTSNCDSSDNFITSSGGVFFRNENKFYYADSKTNKIEFLAEIGRHDRYCLDPQDVLFHFSYRKQKINCYVKHENIKEALPRDFNDSLPSLPKGVKNIIAEYYGHWSLFPASHSSHHQPRSNAIIEIEGVKQSTIDNKGSSEEILILLQSNLSIFSELVQKNYHMGIEKCIAQMEANHPGFLNNLQEVQKIIPDLKLPVELTAKIELLKNTGTAINHCK